MIGCSECHGSGKAYPAELVERIAHAITEAEKWHEDRTVAVLDALNGETP